MSEQETSVYYPYHPKLSVWDTFRNTSELKRGSQVVELDRFSMPGGLSHQVIQLFGEPTKYITCPVGFDAREYVGLILPLHIEGVLLNKLICERVQILGYKNNRYDGSQFTLTVRLLSPLYQWQDSVRERMTSAMPANGAQGMVK